MQIQTPADLARLIKSRRQAQRFTQQEVADAVGITRQSLARIERGNAGTSFDTVLRIFAHLGINLDANSGNVTSVAIPSIDTAALSRIQAVTSRALASVPPIDVSALSALRGAMSQSSAFQEAMSQREERLAALSRVIEATDPDRARSAAAPETDAAATAETTSDD
jgi:transcriptional regulator with XRE-family HTH domain